jgi:hypothetical protein
MSNKSNGEKLQRVVLRVPGPWKRRHDLEARLKDGFYLQRDSLVLPSGRAVALEMLRADHEFPRIFHLACRRPIDSTAQSGLNSYSMMAALVGPAGSMDGARLMLEAGAGLVRAGGIGVFVDNGLIAHSGSDWLELAENSHDPSAVFYAFVNVANIGTCIRSHGMHVIGLRDGIVGNLEDLDSLEDFLRMSSANETDPGDGKLFSDRSGRQFRLRSEVGKTIFANHPINNPYGLWRLEPA